ncbi:MAG: lipid-A-disaccharide synthase [Candidatus Omnitrophica bacterium]|nr:lipid-A-disaccharide synthase [Candidatus Omnitrophota bacterium]
MSPDIPENMSYSYLIVTGEASGDLHAGHLLQALKKREPNTKAWGVGGENLQAAGMDLEEPVKTMTVMGFAGILSKLPHFKDVQNRIVARCRTQPPAAAILVDYSGFNLRLAPYLKKLGIPVFYFISPQVWAWRTGRIRTIKELVDLMIVFFPFEEKLYQEHGVPVKWAGHPLVGAAPPVQSKEAFLSSLGLDPSRRTLALLPGSRRSEVQALLPIMKQAARRISKELEPSPQFLLAQASGLEPSLFKGLEGLPIKAVVGKAQACIAAADLVLTCSGTATMETAALEKPMIVVYKTGALNWMLIRPWVKVEYASMANILAGKQIVPELLQKNLSGESLAQKAVELLKDSQRMAQMQNELAKIKSSLGKPGAYTRAADAILAHLRDGSCQPHTHQ